MLLLITLPSRLLLFRLQTLVQADQVFLKVKRAVFRSLGSTISMIWDESKGESEDKPAKIQPCGIGRMIFYNHQNRDENRGKLYESNLAVCSARLLDVEYRCNHLEFRRSACFQPFHNGRGQVGLHLAADVHANVSHRVCKDGIVV